MRKIKLRNTNILLFRFVWITLRNNIGGNLNCSIAMVNNLRISNLTLAR